MLGLYLWIANVMTFLMAQLLRKSPDDDSRLCTIRDNANGLMNYLVAGPLAQPRGFYDFLLYELDGITMVEYGHRWDAREMARLIRQNIDDCEYQKVRIFTASAGDRVARYLEYWLDETKIQLEVVAINPCPAPQVIRPDRRWIIEMVAPLMGVICILLGWISCIPFIPVSCGLYSLELLETQLCQMADDGLPTITRRTSGIVLSRNCRLIDGDVVQAFFERTPCYFVDERRTDTMEGEAQHVRAVRGILQSSRLSDRDAT